VFEHSGRVSCVDHRSAREKETPEANNPILNTRRRFPFSFFYDTMSASGSKLSNLPTAFLQQRLPALDGVLAQRYNV
jgi:hypothetical protein